MRQLQSRTRVGHLIAQPRMLIEINFYAHKRKQRWTDDVFSKRVSVTRARRAGSPDRPSGQVYRPLIYSSARGTPASPQQLQRIARKASLAVAAFMAAAAQEMVQPTSATRMPWESTCCVLHRRTLTLWRHSKSSSRF